MEYLGHASDAVIALSNYRLHLKWKDSVLNVSLARLKAACAVIVVGHGLPFHLKQRVCK